MARSPIIVIGASAGGVAALRSLAAALPKTLSAPVLIVLHVGAYRSELPALLNAVGPVPAKHAEDGETILPGHIYVAPPDRHMIVDDGRLRLLRGPKENCARPAIDPLFRSVAEVYGSNAVGVILTGNLNDGALGLFEIKRRGGVAMVQDPSDAAYPEMPTNATEHVAVDHCLPLAKMPELLVELVDRKDGKEAVMPKSSSQLDGQEPGTIEDQIFERPLTVTCPDCGGALKKFEVGSMVKFGCHIGHSYTAEILATAQFEEMEKIMRAAERFLNERAEFCLQMADHSGDAGSDASMEWQAASKQALDRAYRLRDLVEQDWITPETSRQLAVADDGSNQNQRLG
ncbi:MAG: chemotaxis protein CheB [Mesorhizobium sp.]|nr:chemotaxis protein CheB [Mesorhizobium sp.]